MAKNRIAITTENPLKDSSNSLKKFFLTKEDKMNDATAIIHKITIFHKHHYL